MSEKSRGKILRETNKLLEWSSTVSIESPDLRLLFDEIASYLQQKPSCQVAVSEKDGTLALIGPDRELRFFSIEDSTLTAISKIKVLSDSLPEWCILKWSQSQNLLISTRSSAIIDVFDSNGAHCYSIQECSQSEGRFQPSSVISHLQTVATSDGTDSSKWLDTLYVMQFDSTFSAFHLGRLSGYEPLFTVNLGLQLCTSFYFSSANGIMLATSRYRLENDFEEATIVDPVALGISAFRIVDSDPYVVDLKANRVNKSEWRDWIPFLSKKSAVVSTTSINSNETLLAAVTSVGDLFIFSLPAMRVTTAVCAFQIDPLYRPTQVCWMNDQELCVMTKAGASVIASYKTICADLSNRESTELFSSGSTLFSADDVIFALESFTTVDPRVPESPNIAKEDKAWLAARIGISTVYDYLKLIIGAAVGQPMEEIKSTPVDQHSRFILHEMKNLTFEDALQQKLRKREYEEALNLSKDWGEDVDTVYKQMWTDRTSKYSPEFIRSSLAEIADHDFVFAECCSNTSKNIEVQKVLLELLGTLEDQVGHDARCIIEHHKRVWDVFMNTDQPSMEKYLHYKQRSLLYIACSVAQDFNSDVLMRVLTHNFDVLEPYLFKIITLIPESTNPRSYEVFLPKNSSRPFEDIARKCENQTKHSYLTDHADTEAVNKWNFDLADASFELRNFTFEEWFMERVSAVDKDSGNADMMIKLLELAIERDENQKATKLRELLVDVEFYKDVVLFCETRHMNLAQFIVTPLKQVITLLAKHLTEEDVCANIERLVSLFAHFKKQHRTEDVAADLLEFISQYSERSLKVLSSVKERYRKYVSDEVLVHCFCLFEITGTVLITNAKRLGIPSNIISALEIFDNHCFYPRFEQVHKSLESETLAEQVFTKLFNTANASSAAEWLRLRDDAFNVRNLIYNELLQPNTVLRLLALKMLHLEEDDDEYDSIKRPIDVILCFDPEERDPSKLSAAESIAVLIDLSRDFWNCAQPEFNDPNLRKARKVLELVPDEFKTSSLREYIRQLSVVDCALRLGCKKLPVVIRLAEADDLLTECVKIDSNYKQVKKCAELASLLKMHNPAARAMELCAEQALKAHDEKTLAKYVEKLVQSAKGLSNIYNVCIDILKSPYLRNMREELISCALLNCPVEELSTTLELTERIRADEMQLAPSDDENCEDTDETIACDAMYSSPEIYFRNRPDDGDRGPIKFCTDKAKLAKRYLRQSATVAVAIMAQEGEQAHPWTNNTEILRYTQALVHAVEAAVPVPVIESLTMNSTVKSFLKEDRSKATPLDRIINNGCDRSRFVEDAKYRMESLVGLAMTNDLLDLDDCIVVAKKFNHALGPIYASFIEHLLTESGMDAKEIAKILSDKPEMVEECLKCNASKWHKILRTTVASSLDLNSTEWLRLYVGLFRKDQIEGVVARVLDELISMASDTSALNWTGILTGNVEHLESLVVILVENGSDLVRVIEIVKQFANGSVAIEDAAKQLLERSILASERQKQVTLANCLALLEDDASGVMELLAGLDETTEKQFIDHVLGVWESNSGSGALLKLLQERQRVLLSPTPPYSGEFNDFNNDFDFNSGFSDSTTMRRRC